MNNVIQSIDRPDVDGVLPKMQVICDKLKVELNGLLPFLQIYTNDNIMSSVIIRGAKEPKEQWAYGYFENATSFIMRISPMNGNRYYDPEDASIVVELLSNREFPKFRKYTGSVDKAIVKIKKWLSS